MLTAMGITVRLLHISSSPFPFTNPHLRSVLLLRRNQRPSANNDLPLGARDQASTLEKLDEVFGVLTRSHMKYQCTKALPYFFQRWVLFNKNAKLEPLYQFDSDEQEDIKEVRVSGMQVRVSGMEDRGSFDKTNGEEMRVEQKKDE